MDSHALRSIKGHRPEDRPDLVSRAFPIKLRHLMNDLMKNEHFSPTKAGQLPEVQFSKALLAKLFFMYNLGHQLVLYFFLTVVNNLKKHFH